jgi:hypothetical protein
MMQQSVSYSEKFGRKSLSRTNSLVNNPLDVKEIEHALDFALHLSPFSVSFCLDFPTGNSCFLLERLSNNCQGLRRTFSDICTKFDAAPSSDSSINHTHDCNYKDVKISMSTQLSEILYTGSRPDITTVAQMAATVPEIMDTPSYTYMSNYYNFHYQIQK